LYLSPLSHARNKQEQRTYYPRVGPHSGGDPGISVGIELLYWEDAAGALQTPFLSNLQVSPTDSNSGSNDLSLQFGDTSNPLRHMDDFKCYLLTYRGDVKLAIKRNGD